MGKRKLVAKLFKNWKENQTEEDGDVPESCSVQGINRVFSKVFEISSVVNYTHFLMWKALDMVAWSSQKPSQQNVFRVPTVLQQIGVVAVVP